MIDKKQTNRQKKETEVSFYIGEGLIDIALTHTAGLTQINFTNLIAFFAKHICFLFEVYGKVFPSGIALMSPTTRVLVLFSTNSLAFSTFTHSLFYFSLFVGLLGLGVSLDTSKLLIFPLDIA